MSWAKLALRALGYVGPPVADWLARKLSTTQNAEEKARIAESNRHATQSGAARDASSDATERMMGERTIKNSASDFNQRPSG